MLLIDRHHRHDAFDILHRSRLLQLLISLRSDYCGYARKSARTHAESRMRVMHLLSYAVGFAQSAVDIVRIILPVKTIVNACKVSKRNALMKNANNKGSR